MKTMVLPPKMPRRMTMTMLTKYEKAADPSGHQPQSVGYHHGKLQVGRKGRTK